MINAHDIDDDMCYLIWSDFHEQYKPFVNSFVKLTHFDTTTYIMNKDNSLRVQEYINNKLVGLRIIKLRLIGRDHIIFTVRRTTEESVHSILKNMQIKIDNLTKIVSDLEEKITKIYYAPNMPGYEEALNEFKVTGGYT